MLRIIATTPFIIASLAVVAAAFLALLSEYFKSVKGNTAPQKYPFHATVRMLANVNRMLDFFKDELDTYKKKCDGETIWCKYLFAQQMVVTSSVENITHVLRNVDNYGKGPGINFRFKSLLGEGIFNTDGEKWLRHRKTSAHLFNLNKFKSGVQDTFNEHCDKLVAILSKSKGPIDIQSLMFKFTLDSIGVIAFGYDIGALSADRVQFAEDFDYCQEIINFSFFDPFWLIKRFLTPSGWKFFLALRRINAYAYRIVANKRATVGKMSPEEKSDDSLAARNGRDLLSLYLSRQDEKEALSDEFLRDIVTNFMIAGRDTTAQALSWAFYNLGCHLDEQKIVQEEVDCVLKKNASLSDSTTKTDHISYDALSEMKYLEAFCMEVLRLHPSVPKEAKHVYGPDTLPDGTVLQGGELLIFSPWIMGRDPNLWENPLKFDPNRFFNCPKPSNFVFTAFQAGPRICLGMNLAILEMKCVLARVLSKFSVQLAQPADSVTYRNSITLPIKDGLLMTFSSR